MTKTYKKGVGGSDTQGLPKGKPSGITAAMNIGASTENATDISSLLGSPNPKRGTNPPRREVRFTKRGSGQTTTRSEN